MGLSTPNAGKLAMSMKLDKDGTERGLCNSEDDGYLYLSRAGKYSGSNRYSKLPIVRYEVCGHFSFIFSVRSIHSAFKGKAGSFHQNAGQCNIWRSGSTALKRSFSI